jgi:hypothetical protein
VAPHGANERRSRRAKTGLPPGLCRSAARRRRAARTAGS